MLPVHYTLDAPNASQVKKCRPVRCVVVGSIVAHASPALQAIAAHELQPVPLPDTLTCAAATQITFGDTFYTDSADHLSGFLQAQNVTAVLGADPTFIVRPALCVQACALHASCVVFGTGQQLKFSLQHCPDCQACAITARKLITLAAGAAGLGRAPGVQLDRRGYRVYTAAPAACKTAAACTPTPAAEPAVPPARPPFPTAAPPAAAGPLPATAAPPTAAEPPAKPAATATSSAAPGKPRESAVISMPA